MSVTMRHQLDIPEVFQVYQNHKNFEIIEGNSSKSRDCYIFFSSHGIYFPNTPEEFKLKVIEGNRFEWKRNIPKSYAKVIFLRDVFKQWYLEGINGEINSIEKLAEFLKQESQGLDIICIGSSAGGYAATLFGALLNAKKVFNFSGQFSLIPYLETERDLHPLLVKHEFNPAVNQYFNISKFIQNSSTPILYLYPGKCEQDIPQARVATSLNNVYDFKFNDGSHGCTVLPISLMDLFERSLDSLVKLQRATQGKFINTWLFSLRVSGFPKTYNYFLSKIYKIFNKKIFKK
ncbi:hypothetical protein [Oscillatoria sp. FACHB-1406]|uniref:hypothetical protein n=1 Tax=Oscillatoria sp. FACHB-1406 TaxID=2692846 RepID=UPI001685FFBF|nr:hypothetical protein [Oscillatoria sp. FACHB-1406]MBD2580227.1 hypothetical protein [Oscillatoria sp. FACHB-1406]